jgi:hypothetical protein
MRKSKNASLGLIQVTFSLDINYGYSATVKSDRCKQDGLVSRSLITSCSWHHMGRVSGLCNLAIIIIPNWAQPGKWTFPVTNQELDPGAYLPGPQKPIKLPALKGVQMLRTFDAPNPYSNHTKHTQKNDVGQVPVGTRKWPCRTLDTSIQYSLSSRSQYR